MQPDPKELCTRITDYLSLGGLFNPELMDPQKVSDLLIDCRTYLSALPQEPSSASMGVVVKALEWASVYGYAARVASPVDIYAITEYAGMADPFKLEGVGHSSLYFSDIEAAKAAAQADFEQRVRSCLSPAKGEREGGAFAEMLTALRQVEAEMRAGLGSSYGETREQVRRAIASAERCTNE